MTETVIVTEIVNNVLISSPGPQGQRGRTILNGTGSPAENLGLEGDFYYDKDTTRIYGPKLIDSSWDGSYNYLLKNASFYQTSWQTSNLSGPTNGIYSIQIQHDLGYNPNVTVKSSVGDILETGIVYNTNKIITLEMAQPFAGTAYLS
jgi:hypothetical protein